MNAANDYETLLLEADTNSCKGCIFEDERNGDCLKEDSLSTCCPEDDNDHITHYHYYLVHKVTDEVVDPTQVKTFYDQLTT